MAKKDVNIIVKDFKYIIALQFLEADAIASEEDDALDAYMTAIKAGVMDTKTRLTLKRELLTLRTEEQRLRHLVNIAKPASLPVLKK